MLALDGAEPMDGMYLSAGSDARSVRDAPGGKLVVGGAGHVVGRTDSHLSHLERLRAWTAHHYPGTVETHHWSAQDYGSPDGVPFVGRMARGGGHIHVATGYEKWGMTNSVVAARTISSDILGEIPPWAKVLDRRSTGAGGRRRGGPDQPRRRRGCPDGGGPHRARAAPRSVRSGPGARVRRGGSVHPPRRTPEVERRRGDVGLPVARLPVHTRRRGAGRSGDPAAAAELRRHGPSVQG